MRKSQLIDAIQSAQNGSSGNRAPSGPAGATRTDDVAAALDDLQRRPREAEGQPTLPATEPNRDGAGGRAARPSATAERGAETDGERTERRQCRPPGPPQQRPGRQRPEPEHCPRSQNTAAARPNREQGQQQHQQNPSNQGNQGQNRDWDDDGGGRRGRRRRSRDRQNRRNRGRRREPRAVRVRAGGQRGRRPGAGPRHPRRAGQLRVRPDQRVPAGPGGRVRLAVHGQEVRPAQGRRGHRRDPAPREGERKEKFNPLVRLETVNGRRPRAGPRTGSSSPS